MNATKLFPVIIAVLLALVAGCGQGRDAAKPADEAPAKAAEKRADTDTKSATDKPQTPVAEARPGELVLPADGGVWPWPLGQWPEVQARPVLLTKALVEREYTVRSAAVNPRAGKAVVLLWENDFKKKTHGTHVLWCDLPSGQMTHRWKISDKYYAAFDLHRDGQRFLLRDSHTEKHILEMWTIAAGDKLPQYTWKPCAASNRGENGVRWAGFVGANHVVTVCDDGILAVWRLDTMQRVGVFANVSGFPTVTPDGERLAFATGENVAVLDPAAAKVIGVRYVGALAKDPVLAFDPRGKTLACAGNGQVTLLDLGGGQVWNAMIAELKLDSDHFLSDFGWAGDQHFYHNGHLFDLHTPIPVWRYLHPKWIAPRGPHVWAVAHGLGDKETALRTFTLPHPTVATKVAEALRQPGLFALRPGDPVAIDVSGLPADRQAEIKATLERRAAKLGYVSAPSSAVVFQASVDKTGTESSITYQFGGSSVKCPYMQYHARLKILKNGKLLWHQSSCHTPPFLITVMGKNDIQQMVKDQYGGPDYKVFTDPPLPGVIRGEGSKNVLGSSELTASGVRDSRFNK